MDILLLPGNSKLNKEWIDKVATSLKPDFKQVFTHYYSHWNTSENMIDFEKELNSIFSILKNSKEYCIFAKSAGIILALIGIKKGKISPKKCIFVGLPLNWAKENKIPIEEFLLNLEIPSLFIQKTDDTSCSFQELNDCIKSAKVKNYSLIEIPGKDHHYEDLSLLRREIVNFI